MYWVHLSMFFQDLTPELILEGTWYRSRGLHLVGAPICVFKKLGGIQSEPFSTRPEPNSTQQVIPCRMEHSTNSPKQEDLAD
jgi:hypothetical protein